MPCPTLQRGPLIFNTHRPTLLSLIKQLKYNIPLHHRRSWQLQNKHSNR